MFFFTILFQNQFNNAISLIVNNGIFQKMERDITTSTAFKMYFDVLWTPETLSKNESLKMSHVLPSFIALGLGLFLASLIFSMEILFHKKWNANQVFGTHSSPVSQPDISNSIIIEEVIQL